MDGSINFSGTLAGSIADSGGDNVDDVKVRHSQTTEYESVVNDEKIAMIDLISYVRRNELAQELQTQEYNFDLKLDLKQNNLIAGENITLKNNVISAKSSGVNYSTVEQNTGSKWVDGRDVYQISFVFDRNVSLPTSSYGLWFNISALNIDNVIDAVFVWASGTKGTVKINQCYVQNNTLYVKLASSVNNTQNSVLTIQYVKTGV